MKRILVIIALCSPLLMQAQSIEHILKSIEQNNKELKAQKHAADATKMENRTNIICRPNRSFYVNMPMLWATVKEIFRIIGM